MAEESTADRLDQIAGVLYDSGVISYSRYTVLLDTIDRNHRTTH